jgi:hypothetical protein
VATTTAVATDAPREVVVATGATTSTFVSEVVDAGNSVDGASYVYAGMCSPSKDAPTAGTGMAAASDAAAVNATTTAAIMLQMRDSVEAIRPRAERRALFNDELPALPVERAANVGEDRLAF